MLHHFDLYSLSERVQEHHRPIQIMFLVFNKKQFSKNLFH